MKHKHPPNRRGAALIIALVLLACLAAVAGVVMPRMLRDRYESRMELVRTQSRQLLDDVLQSAETKRQTEPDFSGMVFTFAPDSRTFSGTFQVTVRFENDAFTAEVEYRNEEGRIVYAINRRQ